METAERNMTVYMHRCLETNKVYVGITCLAPTERWKNGEGYRTNPAFYDDIQKYGWDNMEHIVVASGLTLEEACCMEREYIAKYDSLNSGYNRNAGGFGFAGAHHSSESKKAIGDHLRGSMNPNYQGKSVTEEWRQKQSEAKLGRTLSASHKQKIADGLRGKKHHTESYKKELSLKLQKRIRRSDGTEYNSRNEAAKCNGVSGGAITNAIKRHQKSAGYYWSYIEEKPNDYPERE